MEAFEWTRKTELIYVRRSKPFARVSDNLDSRQKLADGSYLLLEFAHPCIAFLGRYPTRADHFLGTYFEQLQICVTLVVEYASVAVQFPRQDLSRNMFGNHHMRGVGY